jgi:hypothetical protein
LKFRFNSAHFGGDIHDIVLIGGVMLSRSVDINRSHTRSFWNKWSFTRFFEGAKRFEASETVSRQTKKMPTTIDAMSDQRKERKCKGQACR